MPPALALAFYVGFLVCWLSCIHTFAKYFLQSSHAKSRPVAQTERQTACGFASGGWRGISEGKDVFYYSRHTAASSESTLFSCLQRTGHTLHGLNRDLQDSGLFPWVPFWAVRMGSDTEPCGLQLSQQTLAWRQPSPASSDANSCWHGWHSLPWGQLSTGRVHIDTPLGIQGFNSMDAWIQIQ